MPVGKREASLCAVVIVEGWPSSPMLGAPTMARDGGTIWGWGGGGWEEESIVAILTPSSTDYTKMLSNTGNLSLFFK
jgi:hypothetical protein